MLERRDPKITDLERRLSNQIVIGKISQVDHKKARYRVKFGQIETDWLPDTQSRSGRTQVWEGRDVGEQVIVNSPCGDLSQGVILGSIHTDATQAGDNGAHHRVIYPDGTTIDYDDEKNAYSMRVAQGGSFDLIIENGASIGAKGGKLILRAPEGIEFLSDGDLTMSANGGLNIQTGNAITTHSSILTHNDKNIGSTHLHTGVVPGGGLTGVPQ